MQEASPNDAKVACSHKKMKDNEFDEYEIEFLRCIKYKGNPSGRHWREVHLMNRRQRCYDCNLHVNPHNHFLFHWDHHEPAQKDRAIANHVNFGSYLESLAGNIDCVKAERDLFLAEEAVHLVCLGCQQKRTLDYVARGLVARVVTFDWESRIDSYIPPVLMRAVRHKYPPAGRDVVEEEPEEDDP
mmetsp:Transcript_6144/g.14946  ORF Transcript_6144/g.14946 Transcript_6144/m.14946 type:complete len:186 (-) Transcript_6144:190-747(-)